MLEQNKKKTLGRLALIVTTFIWGTSFVVMKDTLQTVPTMFLLALRFSGAAILLFLFSLRELKKIDKGYLCGGMVMGVMLFVAYVFQTYGLVYTTPGKNAFLTAVYCVIVPFLYWLLVKKKPDRFNVAAAVLAIVGIGLISLKGDFSLALGDGLTLVGGLFFALHIIVIAGVSGHRSPLLLTMIQFATAAVLSWIGMFMFEGAPQPISTEAALKIVYLCVMCTAVCFLLQTVGQKYTPPSQSAVILTFESVFGTIISVLFGEQMTARLIFGFIFMFVAVLVSETKLSFLHRKKQEKIQL